MDFKLEEAVEILERTPYAIEAMLRNIPNDFAMNNEGPDTWSPYDVVGHLIHGEKTDWVTRMNVILSDTGDKKFTPFDRFAQLTESKSKSLEQLINEFIEVRKQSLITLKSKKLSATDLKRTGIHPEFGTVTLLQLLATWAVHDLNHIAQIARVIAKQYKMNTGPWINYLPILTR